MELPSLIVSLVKISNIILLTLEIIIASVVSQRGKDKYHRNVTYMHNVKKKKIQINLITKQKHAHSFRKQTYGFQRGKLGGGRNNLEIWNCPIHTAAAAAAAKSHQSCPSLGDPIDGSPPGSSVHATSQARILEWGAIAFSDSYFKS